MLGQAGTCRFQAGTCRFQAVDASAKLLWKERWAHGGGGCQGTRTSPMAPCSTALQGTLTPSAWHPGAHSLCLSVMFEGIPTYPGPDRFWQVVAKYRVNSFYTGAASCGCDAFPALPTAASAPHILAHTLGWYSPHGHPRPSALRRCTAAQARPVNPTGPRHGGRAHQPRGLALVP